MQITQFKIEINMNDITMSKICGLISLSMKAGKLAVGEERAKEAIISFTIIRSGSAYPDLDFLKMA